MSHSFSSEQMSNDVLAGVVGLRHTFLLKASLPEVQRLKGCDPSGRDGWSAACTHCMSAPNSLKALDLRASNYHKLKTIMHPNWSNLLISLTGTSSRGNPNHHLKWCWRFKFENWTLNHISDTTTDWCTIKRGQHISPTMYCQLDLLPMDNRVVCLNTQSNAIQSRGVFTVFGMSCV